MEILISLFRFYAYLFMVFWRGAFLIFFPLLEIACYFFIPFFFVYIYLEGSFWGVVLNTCFLQNVLYLFVNCFIFFFIYIYFFVGYALVGNYKYFLLKIIIKTGGQTCLHVAYTVRQTH